MFHIIDAMAQFEKSLIQERVKAGLKSARSKEQRLGRPKVYANAHTIAELRTRGASWAEICKVLKLSKGTAQRRLLPALSPG
jgi:DNA invertase Pin-like site-specific DNA recombinase